MNDLSSPVDLSRQSLTEGHAVRLTVNIPKPGGLNIISSAEVAAICQALDGLAGEAGLRAVILTGGGDRAFIGGANIKEMAALTPERARTFITGLHGVCDRLRNLPVPVIARIDGYCLGAGLEIAASCDLRVASHTAVFGMPEVKVGIPSVIEAALLPRLVGSGRARELVMTGRTMDAAEALRCGLVERVTPTQHLDGAVDEWLGHIVHCGPRALAAQKVLCQAWEEQPLSGAISAGIDHFARAFETSEPAEMMADFLNQSGKPGT